MQISAYGPIAGPEPSLLIPFSQSDTGQPIAPAATPECAKPIPGKKTILGVDDEIIVAFADSLNVIGIAKYDNTSKENDNLKHFWNWQSDDDDEYDLYQPRSVALTTADLDGDDEAEVVSAFCSDNIGALTALSLKNPEASHDVHYDLWDSTSHDRQGSELGMIDIAAGNLNGAFGNDDADEVVVAFRDAVENLQVVLLNGTSDGGLDYLTWWHSTSHGRGTVNAVSAAVGDLDGDGIDDEIALAIVEDDGDLQIIVLDYNKDGGLTELGWDHWSADGRGGLSEGQPLDVTIGDFFGDSKQEIAVAFQDGEDRLQVGTIVYKPDGVTLQDRIYHKDWWISSAHYRRGLDDVSVASGDVDGDGWDEIITAFADSNDNFQAVTLDSETGSLKFHASVWGIHAATGISSVSVDAGDIDNDGKAEIVTTFRDYADLLQILSFDDNTHCPCDDNGDGMHLRDQRQENWEARFTLVAMGDVDGNNLIGDYTGNCDQTAETRLISMVDRPPYWAGLNSETDVGYGNSINGGSSEEDRITNTYGGSATFDSSFDFGEFEIGPSITKEWEHSTTQSSTHGSSLETRKGWTSPNDGLVSLNTVTYYVYQYEKRDGSGLARVSVPISLQTDAKKMSFWNESGGAQDLFSDSWVPAYRTAWMDKQAVKIEIANSSKWTGADFGQGYGLARVSAWIDGGYVTYVEDSWNAPVIGPEVGSHTGGLGIALTELNGNSTPELVVAWVDSPSGENSAYYRVGWDISAEPTKWSERKQIPGWVGDDTQGAGLDIIDLDGNGQPEMIFGWIDNPAGVNQVYYRVGGDLDANGDSSDWWADPAPIQGNVGSDNRGLGLNVFDSDGSGDLDLVAAWARRDESGEKWLLGYAGGKNVNEKVPVDAWASGHPIPGQIDKDIVGVSLTSADLVADDERPELLLGWIEGSSEARLPYTRTGSYWQLGGEVDKRPTDIEDSDPNDDQFKIKLYDLWWQTNGKLIWRWDQSPDQDGNDREPIYVSVGGANPYWKVDRSNFSEYSTESSQSYNYEVGGEATFLGIGAEGSQTSGFEDGESYTISWENGLLLDGQSTGLPGGTPLDKEYKYVPFTYMQKTNSRIGIKQAYMVMDYFVPWRGSSMGEETNVDMPPSAPIPVVGLTPHAPQIDSPSHPDPNGWYASDTVSFTWAQPGGDPSVVSGYRWYLDVLPDTVPGPVNFGLINGATYEELADGVWWMHLRAKGDGGEWSETGHRAIRLDMNPPQAEITLEPPLPVDNGGWYNTPVSVVITADDGRGSGVQNIEFSTDSVNWQSYTTPLRFETDLPLMTLWARAADPVGHVSEPVSTTFGLDLTLPNSTEASHCWNPDGGCFSGVITDTVGNQRVELKGQLDATLSGQAGLAIQVNNGRWMAADQIVEDRWSFTSDHELGAGCHRIDLQGEDRAGNVEPLHLFDDALIWLPRERPDLEGSRLAVSPDRARPGEEVTFTLSVSNGGPQETWVPISVTLPSGLHVLTDTISADGLYDPDRSLIVWPAEYLWPGQERHLLFRAKVGEDLPAASLRTSLTAVGTWPITEACPAEALPGFLDLQATVSRDAMLNVDPALPDGLDVLPPDPAFLRVEGGVVTDHRNIQLDIGAGPDARRMTVREWVWDHETATWTLAQASGWLPYVPSHPWTLSQGDGVKYLGVWLADEAWNISTLERSGLAFVNLLEGNQALADGQRIQYRIPLYADELALFNLAATEGNPDLYVWQPFSGFRPQYSAAGADFVDTVGFVAEQQGLYLIEVKALGDSRYQLFLGGDLQAAAAFPDGMTASVPDHPLTVSDPLSARAAVAPLPPGFDNELYLPIVIKE